jgi:hypothetical protein
LPPKEKLFVGTDMTETVDPLSFEPAECGALACALQPLLASASLLTLVLLSGPVPCEDAGELSCEVRATLDELEQIARSGIRRTDVVLRCGEYQCALMLLGSETSGALRVMNRLFRHLERWKAGPLPFQIGLASAPDEATESQALIRLALQRSSRLVPPADDDLAGLETVGAGSMPDVPPAEYRRASAGAFRYLGPMNIPAREPAVSEGRQRSAREKSVARPVETFVQARARALGVPYLPAPQRIPSSVRNLLPPEVMQQLRCLPVGRDRNSLTVALVDPTDRSVLRRLEQLTGLTIFPVMTDPDVLESLARPVRSRRVQPLPQPSAGRSGD